MKMDPLSLVHLQTAAVELCDLRATVSGNSSNFLSNLTDFLSHLFLLRFRQLYPKLLSQKVALKSVIASGGQERVKTP